jgi:hypothetical protein
MERVEIWTFRVLGAPGATGTAAGLTGRDLTGWDVEASDGHIGKVDEANDEAGASYLVVDTGFWIFGKKRMLPASVVERLDPEERKIFVNLTKDQIKSAPDWDEVRSKQEDYRREVGDYYYAGSSSDSGAGRNRTR